MSKKISDFVKYLENEVDIHSIYVLSGQGETICNILPDLTSKETTDRVDQILTLISQNLKQYSRIGKFDMMTSHAFDCSGLGTYYFILNDLLDYDTTADGLYKLCKPIDSSELKAGDMVFQQGEKTVEEKDANGKVVKKTVKYMHHVGYYVGNGYVIEAKGRKWGVVKTAFKGGGWTHCGRPKWWSDEKVLARKLKYVEGDLMTGNDVKMVQEQLVTMGYNCGKIDGIFGKKTRDAVKALQQDNDIEPASGNVGKKTCKVLDIVWKG